MTEQFCVEHTPRSSSCDGAGRPYSDAPRGSQEAGQGRRGRVGTYVVLLDMLCVRPAPEARHHLPPRGYASPPPPPVSQTLQEQMGWVVQGVQQGYVYAVPRPVALMVRAVGRASARQRVALQGSRAPPVGTIGSCAPTPPPPCSQPSTADVRGAGSL